MKGKGVVGPLPIGDSMKEDIDEKIIKLEQTVQVLTEQVELLKQGKAKSINKDGLPVDIKIYANVEKLGKVGLVVKEREYILDSINNIHIYGGTEFNSLSAAAEFFSRIKRKSGWIYWRTKNGKTLKDAFKG